MTMEESVIKRLTRAAARGEASRTGAEFARFIARLWPGENEGLFIGAYLACAAIDDSHTCLVLEDDHIVRTAEVAGLPGLEPGPVIRGVLSSGAVGRPGENRPLVLDGGRLYLHRYWSYERLVARRLLELAGSRLRPANAHAAAEMAKRMFPACPARPDWQKIASFSVLFRRLLVISGGPGTGKTRTVTALMALLVSSEPGKEPLLAMCAPTGKAAARLTESVASASRALEIEEEIRKSMPQKALTVHRLLGAGREPGRFRFNRENPLPHHAVILDEASMIDLPMMVHLLDALRPEARLVLIGDRDQLASVEAGSVMKDICQGEHRFSYSPGFVDQAGMVGESLPPAGGGPHHAVKDCIVTLGHSYRFRPGSGIDELATAVNQGDFRQVQAIFRDPELDRARFITASQEDLSAFLEREAVPWARNLAGAASCREAISRMEEFRILSGLKKGPSGVESINRFIHERVTRGFRPEEGTVFKGLPVIINRNSYVMELFNGDTGVVWPDEEQRLKVWFTLGENELRGFSPYGLPPFDPAWAITVHRSQGSEFRKVILVLPPKKTAMPGRELLYTAITRAREEIIIWGSWEDLRACVENRTRRDSGLGELLWAGAGQ